MSSKECTWAHFVLESIARLLTPPREDQEGTLVTISRFVSSVPLPKVLPESEPESDEVQQLRSVRAILDSPAKPDMKLGSLMDIARISAITAKAA